MVVEWLSLQTTNAVIMSDASMNLLQQPRDELTCSTSIHSNHNMCNANAFVNAWRGSSVDSRTTMTPSRGKCSMWSAVAFYHTPIVSPPISGCVQCAR